MLAISRHGTSGSDARSDLGRRRLASEMISIARSDARRVVQLAP
jgi:hypothetical protein